MKNTSGIIFFSLFLAMASLPLAVRAESAPANQNAAATPITGVVVAVAGSRMTIQGADGKTQDVTANAAVPETLVGKTVKGTIKPLGDTYLIVDFVANN